MDTKLTAFIVTGNHVNQLGSISEDMPGCMVYLLDRPWLQHMIEALVNRGVKNFHFFNCDFPLQIEQYFQDGKRWGAEFTYHLGRDEKALLKQISLRSEAGNGEMVLLAQANSILFDIPQFNEGQNIGRGMFAPTGNEDKMFSWHLVKPDELRLAEGFDTYKDFSLHLKKQLQKDRCQIFACSEYLLLDSIGDLIRAQNEVLSGKFSSILCNANEIEPGIRVARNVSIEPSAKVIAPVFIGENSQISSQASIGPNASIGSNCIIDRATSISNSSVFSGTYVGESLNINNSIVNHNQLMNLDINGRIYLSEDFLLGNVQSGRFVEGLQNLLWRLIAVALFIAFLPLLILAILLRFAAAGRNKLFIKKDCISTPNSLNDPLVKQYTRLTFSAASLSRRARPYHSLAHFFLDFLPGLPAVIMGRMSLIGLQSRTEEEFNNLSSAHKKVFLKGKSGLVTENQVFFAGIAGEQELLAAETLHFARGGFFYDMKLLLRYFASFFSLPA